MIKYLGTKIVEAEYYEQCRFGHDEHGNVLLRPAGYIVKYPDGYESWSPKKVFEEAYRPIDALTFGLAIEALKKGHRVARKGWNGNGIFIELQVPDAHSKMTQPYIFIDTLGLQTNNPNAPKGRVPWLASQTDMLAEDWQIVE